MCKSAEASEDSPTAHIHRTCFPQRWYRLQTPTDRLSRKSKRVRYYTKELENPWSCQHQNALIITTKQMSKQTESGESDTAWAGLNLGAE